MSKLPPMRFSVRPEDEEAAIEHFLSRGFQPAEIERDGTGLVVLIFPIKSNEDMGVLASAVPLHLSAKRAIVAGDRETFKKLTPNGR